ncbi:hypothetical protein PYJP_00600 [Pyrofollis japonicus]|uniref:hypothetical protein n=1 Tax=Pyrofollis japonicus TaxID=3060460 RepID=UPI00295ACE2B|nr:hypothetical protein [Pyrofollis japonicus]BEP16708.1 hypothetical protein PYJP_00600 [Pyrofollis japonicus]
MVLITVGPAKRLRTWRLVAETEECRILEAEMHGYKVVGIDVESEDRVAPCLRSLAEHGLLSCTPQSCMDSLEYCVVQSVSSSVLLAKCGDAALRLYLAHPVPGWEPVLLPLLAAMGAVPQVYGRLVFLGEPAGIVTEWVSGESLGDVAIREAEEYLLGGNSTWVARRAASLLADIHKSLAARGLVRHVCRARRDISERVEWYVSRLPRTIANELKNVVKKAAELPHMGLCLAEGPTHQDPHLYQFVARGNEVLIIDLVGEPFRYPGSSLVTEPLVRDLAVLLRSLSYAALLALKRSQELEGTKRRLAAEWLRASTEEALSAYNSRTSEVTTIDDYIAIGFFVAERLVYEAWYEYLYETGLLDIVVEAAKHKQLRPDV